MIYTHRALSGLKIAARSATDLIESVLHPAALDLCAQFMEEISEMTNQLRKQTARIRELRSIKEEEPGKPL